MPAGSVYAVSVDIGGDEEEEVQVDPIKGPLVEQWDGSLTHFAWGENNGTSHVGPTDCRELNRSWKEQGRTEQTIILHMVAKKNKKLREWRGSAPKRAIDPQLPDFLVDASHSAEFCSGAARWKPAWTMWDDSARDNFFARMSESPPSYEDEEKEFRGPILCCWYSGGLTPEKGREQLAGVVKAARKAGIEALVLDFPDSYGIQGEGSAPWAGYVDRLVQEIDGEPSRRGRPLIVYGHSRGATPALTVAAKLKARVLKVFVLANGAPKKGQPSAFQFLAEAFKQGTDMDLLKWFAGLNPSPVLHRTIASVESGEIKLSDSKYLLEMLATMKKQYVNTIWPDMSKDMDGITAPITVVSPRKDPDAQPPACWGFKEWTSGTVDVKVVDAGHMDVVNHYADLVRDMQGLSSTAPRP